MTIRRRNLTQIEDKKKKFPGTVSGGQNLQSGTLKKLGKHLSDQPLPTDVKDKILAQKPKSNIDEEGRVALTKNQPEKKEKAGVFGPESERSFLDKINPFEKQDPVATQQAIEDREALIAGEGVIKGRFQSEDLGAAALDAAALGPAGEIAGQAVGLGVRAVRGGKVGANILKDVIFKGSKVEPLVAQETQVVRQFLSGRAKDFGTAKITVKEIERGLKAQNKKFTKEGAKVFTKAVNDYAKTNPQLGSQFESRIVTLLKAPESITNHVTAKAIQKDPFLNRVFWNTGRVAPNAKTSLQKVSYLQKLAATAKNPLVMFSILGTVFYTSLFWAPNERGDALTTLSIAQGQAARNGDVQGVEEANELIQETANIAASIPVTGFLKSEKAKVSSTLKASEIYMRSVEDI